MASYSDNAREIVAAAISELQGLAKLALQKNDYSEVAEIARLAERLCEIVSSTSGPAQSAVKEPTLATRSAPTRPSSPRRIAAGEYPKFRRDGDKLVKIGWSKKGREEYEHRAPKQATFALVTAIKKKAGDGEYFKVPDVLPLVTDRGEHLPDYQGYLALKWLHGVGLVRKKGRDQYALVAGKQHHDEIEKNWNGLESI